MATVPVPGSGATFAAGSPELLTDSHGRRISDLRVSVTDRCNFRCQYCMPTEGLAWMDREQILSFEEIERLVSLLTSIGIEDVRLTGGEPLVRREFPKLVARLSGLGTIRDLSLTTNGYLLGRDAAELAAAGLDRINVSIDALERDCFFRLTRRDSMDQVLEGLKAPSWRGLRRGPRGDRPDQGRGTGLEGRSRGRRRAAPGRRNPAGGGSGTGRVMSKRLTHIGEDGQARMVDVGEKDVSERMARARAMLAVSPETAKAVADGTGPKGEVAQVARIAGIQAAKRTAELIPLAHPLPLTYIDVEVSVDPGSGLVEVTAEARTRDRTGVEMEAMTACSVAALTIYDMVKGIERGVSIEQAVLIEKRGGRSGHWLRGDADDSAEQETGSAETGGESPGASGGSPGTGGDSPGSGE